MHTSRNASVRPLPILIAVILGGMTPSLAAEDKDPQNDKKGSIPEGIVITVLGGTGSRSLAEFRVIAGTPARGVTSEEFRKRTGHDAVAWQPHTLKIGKEGRYVWPLNKAYREMALRVEADGFEPQIRTGIRRDAGPVQIVVKLRKDAGVNGRVMKPDGEPATDAVVALALAQRNAVIENGRLRNADKPLPKSGHGTFVIDHVLPGYYQLFVSTPGGKNHAGFASFRIEPEDAGDGNATPPIHVLDTIRVK